MLKWGLGPIPNPHPNKIIFICNYKYINKKDLLLL